MQKITQRWFIWVAGVATVCLLGMVIGVGMVHADTAPAYDAGLSQAPANATPLTDFEKQALACRNTTEAKALLTVGSMTPSDRQILGIGSSAASDWCVFLKTRLDNPQSSEVEGLNPGFGQCLMKFIEAGTASGGAIRIYSGYRSNALQAQLYAAALQKYGSASVARQWVAPPGGSMHNRGLAADLSFNGVVGILPTACASNTACAWAHASAAAFGLNFRLANEYWHIEPVGSACQTVGSAPTTVASNDQTQPVTAPAQTVTDTTSGSASQITPQGLIQSALDAAGQGQGGSAIPAQLVGPNGLLGNLFSSILGAVASSTGQAIGSAIQNAVTGGGNNTTANGANKTDYIVLSEDGTLLGQSTVSAQDALAKARAYYNANTLSPSSQAHLANASTSVTTSGITGQYQLSDGTTVYLTSNTFPAATTDANSGNASNSGTSGVSGMNGIPSFIRTFIGQVFGLLGAAFGNLKQ